MNQISNIIPDIEFVEGLPDKNMFCDPNENTLLILDDLMDEIGKSSAISKLFTMDSHHCNTSVFSILHNQYNQEKFTRTMSLNTHYLINFPNKRDKSQITRLNTQIFPSYPGFLQAVSAEVAKKPYEPFIVNLHPDTPEYLSVIANIFPGSIPTIFTPPDGYK
jgi:hypothetical protein